MITVSSLNGAHLFENSMLEKMNTINIIKVISGHVTKTAAIRERIYDQISLAVLTHTMFH